MNRWKPLWQSGKDDWETPPDLIEHLCRAFKFDLDVCASGANIPAKHRFTPHDDGLSQEWIGTCWMNPPYSEVGRWVERARRSIPRARTLCLVMSRTDTRWWQNNVPFASLVVFIRGRLRFGGAENSAPAPSALIMFGQPTPEERECLSALGMVVVPDPVVGPDSKEDT
jgi:phage N-6-adenine-methyltransferase